MSHEKHFEKRHAHPLVKIGVNYPDLGIVTSHFNPLHTYQNVHAQTNTVQIFDMCSCAGVREDACSCVDYKEIEINETTHGQ